MIPTRLSRDFPLLRKTPLDLGDVPRQGQCTADVVETRRTPSGVCERTVGHFENSPSVASHSHERSWRRERKFDGSRRESIIRFSLGMLFNECRQIAGVIRKLLGLVMNDVGRHSI